MVVRFHPFYGPRPLRNQRYGITHVVNMVPIGDQQSQTKLCVFNKIRFSEVFYVDIIWGYAKLRTSSLARSNFYRLSFFNKFAK